MIVKTIMLVFASLVFRQYCIAQKVDSIKPVHQKVNIKVYPNPVKNKAIFKLQNFDAGIVQMQIIDVNGTIVYNEKRLVVLKEDEITIFFQLKSGTYWCIVTQKERTAKTTFNVVP